MHAPSLAPAERLEDVAATLEELWMSYNGVASLDGLAPCARLRVLYLSNNQVRAMLQLSPPPTLQRRVRPQPAGHSLSNT